MSGPEFEMGQTVFTSSELSKLFRGDVRRQTVVGYYLRKGAYEYLVAYEDDPDGTPIRAGADEILTEERAMMEAERRLSVLRENLRRSERDAEEQIRRLKS